MDFTEMIYNATFTFPKEKLYGLTSQIRRIAEGQTRRTVDHCFIYQNRELDESDFTVAEPDGEQIHYRDRRLLWEKG